MTGSFLKAEPKPILDSLERAVAAALNDPDVAKRLSAIGARAPGAGERGGAAMQRLMGTEIDRWADIRDKAGFKPD